MGFPVGYSELLLPRLLLQALLLLGHLHRLLLWAFHAVGLGDLIDLGGSAPVPTAEEAQWHRAPRTGALALALAAAPAARLPRAAADGRRRGGAPRAAVRRAAGVLPVRVRRRRLRRLPLRHRRLPRGAAAAQLPPRLPPRLHRRWMGHGQRTCPLCRAPLMPGDALWADLPDASDYDMSYSSPLPLAATPTLLRPHELLLNGLGGFQ
uniref:Uncharacterized protein n=1 Tax=Triticum urartu TaxID=4572 RepID=A0A8R7UT07_TRIUA